MTPLLRDSGRRVSGARPLFGPWLRAAVVVALALGLPACSYPEHVFDLGTEAGVAPDVSIEAPANDANADEEASGDTALDSPAEAAEAAEAAEDAVTEPFADAPAESSDGGPPDAPIDSEAGMDGPADVEVDAPAPCPGTHGPTMVRVGPFCIDSTEVTNAQYAQFLIAKGTDTSGQPAACAWNTTYELSFPYWPQAAALPVRSADWCDAYMFCKWAGKRLCGKIGGGSVPLTSQFNAGVDQWYYVCTGAATKLWPYGDSYDPSVCHCKDLQDAGTLSAAGSLPECQGGFPGVFDMSCNVWEWEDSCDGDTGATDKCTARGASWAHTGGTTQCTTSWQARRDQVQADMGFRCCAE